MKSLDPEVRKDNWITIALPSDVTSHMTADNEHRSGRREADLTFEEISAEMWALLEPLRRETASDPHCRWVQLKRMESMEGNLCGLRLREPGLVGSREVAQFIASATLEQGTDFSDEDRGLSYRLEAWRKNHGPQVIWKSDNSKDRADRVGELVDAFRVTVKRIREIQQRGIASEHFPDEWTGTNGWTLLPNALGSAKVALAAIAGAGLAFVFAWAMSGGDWLDWRFATASLFASFGAAVFLMIAGSRPLSPPQVRRTFYAGLVLFAVAILLVAWRLLTRLFG